MRRIGLFLLATLVFLGGRPAWAEDLSKLDLTGEWYVLIHYKDARSEDKSLTNFKDFAWSIQQEPSKLSVEEFPYVLFDEDLREHVDVSSRAARKKELTGDFASGMKSGAAGGVKTGTMSFTRNWDVTWAPAAVRIVIVDSLGGGNALLGDMEEASSYEISARPAPDELTGTWSEGEKSGSLRMIRAKEGRVVK